MFRGVPPSFRVLRSVSRVFKGFKEGSRGFQRVSGVFQASCRDSTEFQERYRVCLCLEMSKKEST